MLRITFVSLFIILCNCAVAQDDILSSFRREFESFKKEAQADYDDFRDKCNKEYADFILNAWKKFKVEPAMPVPDEEWIDPKFFPIKDLESGGDAPSVLINPDVEIVPLVAPTPQPQPVTPIKEVPEFSDDCFVFDYCGAECKVRIGENHKFKLMGNMEPDINKAWKFCSSGAFDNVLADCLRIRESNSLCDWAYLQMLQKMTVDFFGRESDEATLLLSYLFCQSGYKMRMARNDRRLYLLYSCQHVIYGKLCLTIDGEKYYPLNYKDGDELYVCGASFYGEQSLSLWMNQTPKTERKTYVTRVLQSKRYPDFAAETRINKELLNFFEGYPSSEVGGDKMTCWAMYARTPISDDVKESLYPKLKTHLLELSEDEAVNRLLDLVQTSLEYEYDDVVWGDERVFFSEESLFYPYCDCEDRSILFSRLVRDLLGLDVALVYYPGHLATAVCFETNVQGDYFMIAGRRFVICDPTYINAPIGKSMPGLDNNSIEVIVL